MSTRAGSQAGTSAREPGALALHQQAAVVGGYRWVEQHLFELLGAWVRDEPAAAARVLFDAQSQQHAWHSELFAERLPVLDGFDAETLTAPSAHVERALSLAGSGGGTVVRLAALGRFLLPRLVTGYALHLRRAAPVADAPLVRALRLVVRDEIEAWQAAEALLEETLLEETLGGSDEGAEPVSAAAGHVGSLEALLAGSGPGLVPWPAGPPDEQDREPGHAGKPW